MTFRWKIPAVAAGGAFLLSLIIGAAGRVTFGMVMLRAFIWAVVFAALAFGIDFLLRKYLPELLAGEADEPAGDERSIDITLEEENPVSAAKADFAGEPGYREDSTEEASFGTATADDETAVGELEEADGAEEPVDFVGGVDLHDAAADGGEETAFDASGDSRRAGTPRQANIDFLGIDEDPATVARAVRTFMKKDQEG
ncbi:MAG: hypothetical protein JW852_11315 [Spirochaetales bacterium]|nr:hypothetical protein [Spirochaetales bacterium]